MALKRTLLHKLRTADGHEAHVFHTKNNWLIHKDLYTVHIYSKQYYRGFRRAVIYGWTGIELEEAKEKTWAWTADEIFSVNPYLRNIALGWAPRVYP